jgi:hypothetical protein
MEHRAWSIELKLKHYALGALRLAKPASIEIKIRTAECQWCYGGLRVANSLWNGKGRVVSMEVLHLDLIQKEEGDLAPVRLRLVVRAYPSDSRGYVSLTPDCETIEGFEKALAHLKENMDNILESAKTTFQQHRAKVEDETAVTDFHSSEEIWQALEECSSIEEMRVRFNELSLRRRQEVADYVLTELNIFKGAASIFSQHYNEQEYQLE